MSFPRIVEAALELQAAVRELGAPFCFIGGVAVQRLVRTSLHSGCRCDGVLMRHGRSLNVGQILAELRPLVDLKEDPTIVPRLEALMRKRDVI